MTKGRKHTTPKPSSTARAKVTVMTTTKTSVQRQRASKGNKRCPVCGKFL